MASIQNHGRKGWIFFGIVTFFVLFILLWIYVIGRNGEALPDAGISGFLIG